MSDVQAGVTRTAAIVGCGVLGQGWAVSFLRGGWDVAVFDRDLAAMPRARSVIEERLVAVAEKAGGSSGFGRITEHRDLATAVDGVHFVQESTRERLSEKADVFADLDRAAAPETVLSSSTSSLRATDFTGELAGRNRCIVAHPLNPPYLLPAVEVVPSAWTTDSTVDATLEVMRSIGQAPFVVQTEGVFPLTRLQAAMLSESMRLVQEGVLTPDAVDIAVRQGLGLRWALTGPFETLDLNSAGGFRSFITEYGEMFQRLLISQRASDPAWSDAVVDEVERARRSQVPIDALPEHSRARDARLLALLGHLDSTRTSRSTDSPRSTDSLLESE